MKIVAWDQRTCGACQRLRVHYRTGEKSRWQCIGTLPAVRDIVVPCGKRRRLRLVTNKEEEKK